MRSRVPDKTLELCLYCPTLCLSRCPVSLATGNVAFSPCGKMSAAWRVRQGIVPPDAQGVRPLWMCLDCLACREACDHGQDVPAALAAARLEFSASAERGPAEEAQGPPVIEDAWDPEEAWRLLRDAAPAWRRADDCQVLLAPGRELLTPAALPVLQAAFRVLEDLGDRVLGVNRDSVLECGHLPFACARLDAAVAEAKRACARYGRYAKIVLASPHCASFVRLRWPELELDRSRVITTLLEYVGPRVDLSRPAAYAPSVAYHDPCHLGRHLGLYQLPRDLLKWATNRVPVELRYNHNRGLCCGGGYPLPVVHPAVADAATQALADLFRESGADVLAVACGACRERLLRVAPDLPVKHIVEILDRRRS